MVSRSLPTFRRMPELPVTSVEIEDALVRVRRMQADRSDSRALSSIVEQLDYLLAHSMGLNDGAAIRQFTIGVLAAREIEDVDLDLANALHRVDAALKRANA